MKFWLFWQRSTSSL